MATFLDFAVLDQFATIFVFVLVLVVVYAVLATTKALGGNVFVNILVALVLAIFLAMSELLSGIIRYITPWFALLAIFFVFILVAAQMMGASAASLGAFKVPLLIIIVLVFVIGAASYLRDNVNAPGDIDENGNVIQEKDYTTTTAFLFHPKMLALVFILLVSIFTIALLAGKSI